MNLKPPLIDLLYQAYNSKYGIVVATNGVDRLKVALYQARKQDPDLACLSIVTSRLNPEGEIWIVKNESALKKAHPTAS